MGRKCSSVKILHTVCGQLKLPVSFCPFPGQQINHASGKGAVMRGIRRVGCVDGNENPLFVGPSLENQLMIGNHNIMIASVTESVT